MVETKGCGRCQVGAVVVPGHLDVGVVAVDHEAHHVEPEEHRHAETEQQQQRHRLLGGQRGGHQHGDPDAAKARDQQAVPGEDGRLVLPRLDWRGNIIFFHQISIM